MIGWIFIIVAVWFISKEHYMRQIDNTPLSVEFLPVKKEVTEEAVLEAQTKFEKKMTDVFLPDAISGKEIYIYKNLMSVWYAKFAAVDRYDDKLIQKLRTDWLSYMESLREKSKFYYLSVETGQKAKAESYQNDFIITSKKVSTIEDAFATAAGKDAVAELARIRSLDELSAFTRDGELIPPGYEVNAQGKIQPIKIEPKLSTFFKKLIRK